MFSRLRQPGPVDFRSEFEIAADRCETRIRACLDGAKREAALEIFDFALGLSTQKSLGEAFRLILNLEVLLQ